MPVPTRTTKIIYSRYARRRHRTQAALEKRHGLAFFSIEQLAARLAGGFLQPIDPDQLKQALRAALVVLLGELDDIKHLPGFTRAAAATLFRLWQAGLSLDEEIARASDSAVKERLASLAALEKAVLDHLPANQLRPTDLVARGFQRIAHAPAIFGSVEIHGHTELAPVWRPLIEALADVTQVTWQAEDRVVPAWLDKLPVTVNRGEEQYPLPHTCSCASPRHEILEALRWARSRLAAGAMPEDIAIAAASPENWDDHMLALAENANLPVHFVHGRKALSTPEGQLTAALAEILLRGLSRARVVRLMALLKSHSTRFSAVPGNWWWQLDDNAPLIDTRRWQGAMDRLREQGAMAQEAADLLVDVIETLGRGVSQAGEIGARLLEGKALGIWEKALLEGPPQALDVTLAGLRVDDGLEQEACIAWGPASALAAAPRPRTWLVGLTSRSWPRRASEDSLLPGHIIEAARLDPLPVHLADRRDFETLRRMSREEWVCSRARRDSEGRLNGVSPLYPRDDRDAGIQEVYLAQSRIPEHAASATDRLLARPAEFRELPLAASARQAWRDWHRHDLTPHDGLIRRDHPLLGAALDRTQSATSLVKLLRDPLGYLWQYGFGWSQPEESEEPLVMDALSFGSLLHAVLRQTVILLEGDGGFAAASGEKLAGAVARADAIVEAQWRLDQPTPPPVIWEQKRREVRELALAALRYGKAPLPEQRCWAEIPFGGGRDATELSETERQALPWNAMETVSVPDTGLRIMGSIDRLDLAGDGAAARVTDYKSGAPPKPSDRDKLRLKGGAELQRCLYAFAVQNLVPGVKQVDARLLYPRGDCLLLPLEDPAHTLETLTGYLAIAETAFREGRTLPGPDADKEYHDFAFALPGGARENYLDNKKPLVEEALRDLRPLWDEH